MSMTRSGVQTRFRHISPIKIVQLNFVTATAGHDVTCTCKLTEKVSISLYPENGLGLVLLWAPISMGSIISCVPLYMVHEKQVQNGWNI